MKRLVITAGGLLAVVAVAVVLYQARERPTPSLGAGATADDDQAVESDCAAVRAADADSVDRDQQQRRRLAEKAGGSEAGTVSFAFDVPVSLDAVKMLAAGANATIHTLTATYFPFTEETNFTSSMELRDRPVDVVAAEWRLRMVASLARRPGSAKPEDLLRVDAVKGRIEQGELPIAGVRLAGRYRDLAPLAEDDNVFSVSIDAIDARLPDDAATVEARESACGGEG